MLDEKMEKSKKYTWHLLHGIQKNVFFIKLLSFLTMIFVEAQLRALRKSPVDPTELVQHLRRNACFSVCATLGKRGNEEQMS